VSREIGAAISVPVAPVESSIDDFVSMCTQIKSMRLDNGRLPQEYDRTRAAGPEDS